MSGSGQENRPGKEKHAWCVCVCGGVYFLTFQLQGLAQVMQEAAGGRNVKNRGPRNQERRQKLNFCEGFDVRCFYFEGTGEALTLTFRRGSKI